MNIEIKLLRPDGGNKTKCILNLLGVTYTAIGEGTTAKEAMNKAHQQWLNTYWNVQKKPSKIR